MRLTAAGATARPGRRRDDATYAINETAYDANVGRLTLDSADPEAAETAQAVVLTIQREQDDLADQLARGTISATLAARAEPGILARLKAAQRHRDELTKPSIIRGLLARPKRVTIAKWWAHLPGATKREIVRLLFSPSVLGELHVGPSTAPDHHQQPPANERVHWRRIEETAAAQQPAAPRRSRGNG